MTQNCARPGCGHLADHHVWAEGTPMCEGTMHCLCPGYRTQAQQEAWEWLIAENARFGWRDVNLRGSINRVLELYP